MTRPPSALVGGRRALTVNEVTAATTKTMTTAECRQAICSL